MTRRPALPKLRRWADVPAAERMSKRDFLDARCAYARVDTSRYYGDLGLVHKYWWRMRVAQQQQGCAMAIPQYGWPGKWTRCRRPLRPGADCCHTHGGPRPMSQADQCRERTRLWADVPVVDRLDIRPRISAACQMAVRATEYGAPTKWKPCEAAVQSGQSFCRMHGGLGKSPDTSLPIQVVVWRQIRAQVRWAVRQGIFADALQEAATATHKSYAFDENSDSYHIADPQLRSWLRHYGTTLENVSTETEESPDDTDAPIF